MVDTPVEVDLRNHSRLKIRCMIRIEDLTTSVYLLTVQYSSSSRPYAVAIDHQDLRINEKHRKGLGAKRTADVQGIDDSINADGLIRSYSENPNA